MIRDVIDLIKLHEGFSPRPYKCPAGAMTIGYGRNLDANGITTAEGEVLLRNDLYAAISELRMEPYWLDLSEVRQAVLSDMVFNLGWPRFSRFVKLREAVYQRDWDEAARQMEQSKWYAQVGSRAKRLVGMMLTDQWPAA